MEFKATTWNLSGHSVPFVADSWFQQIVRLLDVHDERQPIYCWLNTVMIQAVFFDAQLLELLDTERCNS